MGTAPDAASEGPGVEPADISGLLHDLSTFGRPDEAAAFTVDALVQWGATRAAVYLVDYEHQLLVPLTGADTGTDADGRLGQGFSDGAVDVEGTMAGRCFSGSQPVETSAGASVRRWFPIGVRADGAGVLEIEHPADHPSMARTGADVAVALGFALADAGRCTDTYHRVRRRRPMSLSAEMQWSLLPPQSFAVPEVVVSGQLEPAYDVGGDVFDYALDGDILHLALLDGMGHGVEASLLATAALGAYRHGRRTGEPMSAFREEMDRVVASFFRKSVFVTGVLAKLGCSTGHFHWMSAGHPPPMLLRNRSVVKNLECPPATPFGLGSARSEVCEEQLEPGDKVLFYTDGVVDSRSAETGEVFGEQGLRDFLEHEAAADQLDSEALRRLTRSLSVRSRGQLGDDATVLLVHWIGPRRRPS